MADTDVSACGHAEFGRRAVETAPLQTSSPVIIREGG
jgi:hypothetical protein